MNFRMPLRKKIRILFNLKNVLQMTIMITMNNVCLKHLLIIKLLIFNIYLELMKYINNSIYYKREGTQSGSII